MFEKFCIEVKDVFIKTFHIIVLLSCFDGFSLKHCMEYYLPKSIKKWTNLAKQTPTRVASRLIVMQKRKNQHAEILSLFV